MECRNALETLTKVALKYCTTEELADVIKSESRLSALIKKEEPFKVRCLKGEGLEPIYMCGNCGSTFVMIYKNTKLQRCGHCGQMLDWKTTDDMKGCNW